MRDFSKTQEPSGTLPVKPSQRLRFVIQKHAATRLHYDLRLELDGVFKSWAVTRGPSLTPEDKRLAVEVEDHPLDYGDFEGTIPKGQYGGGTVQLWDRGYWEPLGDRPPEEQLRRGELKLSLAGERLHGSWVLVRMKGDRYAGKRINWLLIKHRDEHARAADETAALIAQDRSVASGRAMSDIAAGKGRGPKPFMLDTRRVARPDATWNSSRNEQTQSQPEVRASAPQSAGRSKKAPTRAGKRARTNSQKVPEFVEPELCKLVERPPTGDHWGHEVKLDGYRMQLRVAGQDVTLKTRKGLDWTEKFAAIAAAARGFPDCIIDGEVTVLDRNGAPDFAALQAALSEADSSQMVFFVFDLMHLDGEDLRKLTLRDRKARLQALLASERPSQRTRIRYVDHFETAGDAVLQSACRMNLEGIISKRLDAPYRSGRAGDWIKTKCRAGHEVVIGGFTQQSGQLRSLLVGVYRRSHLVHVGRVGTGFSRETTRQLMQRLKPLIADTSPFGGENAPRKKPDMVWVEPQLVAEIEFAGWTASGNVRQASFKGLRADKTAKEVRAERPAPVAQAEIAQPAPKQRRRTRAPAARAKSAARSTSERATRNSKSKSNASSRRASASASSSSPAGNSVVLGIPVSNPDKPLWPDGGGGKPVTKLDLARYLERVGEWMLTHIKGRPCSIIRAPDGIHGQKFFQRHAMRGSSNLLTLTKVSDDYEPYVQIDRIEALIAVAQSAALELHPWNCQPFAPEVPGRLVFDLDPGPELGFDAVIAAAREMKERLEALGLAAFCKTTGGKGLHVVTPLAQPKRGTLNWPEAKAFAQAVCAQMAADSPDRYVLNMAKRVRTGKIFLDYLRNDRMSTAVAPLSPRAREGAPVSVPLTWQQVKPGLDPMRYTLHTVPSLISRMSAWQDYCESERPLEPAIREVVGNSTRASAPTRTTRTRTTRRSGTHAQVT